MRRTILFLVVALCASAGAQPFPESDYERILIPLLVPPARGAFGALFETSLTVSTKFPQTYVDVHGLRADCLLLTCTGPVEDSTTVGYENEGIPADKVHYDGTPGRFLYVRKDQLPNLYAHLRVRDTTRETFNLGTELPLVRSAQFAAERVFLRNDFPEDGYRSSLRIYAPQPTVVHMRLKGRNGRVDEHVLQLAAGATIYDPAFAYFGAFPERGWLTVTIDAETGPIWAFMTLTNNETQMITLITPQP